MTEFSSEQRARLRQSVIRSASLAALALAAGCRDVAAPEFEHAAPPATPATPATIASSLDGARLLDDSAAVWSAAALDDAEARLATALPDGKERRELIASLRGISARLGAGRGDARAPSLEGLPGAAGKATPQLLRRSDAPLPPALNAIAPAPAHTRRTIDGKVKPP